MSGRAAQAYFEALQCFFNGVNLFTYKTDKDLRFAIDNLLRVISRRDAKNGHYEIEKTHGAARQLEKFRQSVGIGYEFYVVKGDAPQQVIQTLRISLSEMLESADTTKSEDTLALRVFTAFARYAHLQTPKELFPKTSPSLHQSMRDYLELGLAVNLNARLPDYVDNFSMQELKNAAGGSFEKTD